MFKRTRVIVTGLFLSITPVMAAAADRHFAYNYETGVLVSGERELETYTTYRFGRDSFYSAMDQSVEFETGLGGDVQTSIYLNLTQELADAGSGPQMGGGPVLDGISNEWKIKLADSAADGLGLGFYFEPEFEPDEFDFETKLLIDKRMDDWLWCLNILAAPAFDYTSTASSFLLRPSMGLGCFVTEKFFLGFESMLENFYDDQPMRSVFSLGPALQYSGKDWWIALTYLPQIANIGSGSLNFTDSQRNQVRLATSFDL